MSLVGSGGARGRCRDRDFAPPTEPKAVVTVPLFAARDFDDESVGQGGLLDAGRQSTPGARGGGRGLTDLRHRTCSAAGRLFASQGESTA